MIVKKIIYNNGKNEGYFIETRKGFVQVMIKEGEALELTKIKKISEIRMNEATLKIEEVERHETYFG
jgi:hypothetical protein